MDTFPAFNSYYEKLLATEDDGFVLVTLDFLLFDEASFFCPDAFKQNGCGLVVGILRYKFALYRPL